MLRRFSSGKRTTAKANANVKMMSGRIASLAAAFIGLVGTIARRNSLNGGTLSGGGVTPNALVSAAAASPGIGKMPVSVGIIIAAIIDDVHSSAIIIMTPRVAIFPARAACAVCTMPTINSDTTKGTTVILRPLSQTVPMTSAASLKKEGAPVANIPNTKPATRLTKMIVALFKVVLPKS